MMNRFLFFVSILLAFVSCKSYRVKNVYFKSETKSVNAKIIRVDSLENEYVYFLKNDTLNAYFTKSFECKNVFKSVIDTTQNYQLLVYTDATYNYYSKTRDMWYFLDKKSDSFNYDEYNLILLDSPEICGRTVDCKENLEFKAKFFESIKFIDTLIYSIQGRKFLETLKFLSQYTHVSYESMANYAGIYPSGAYEKDRKIWLEWYEKNKCTNIQFKN